jgi:hypothetical protein
MYVQRNVGHYVPKLHMWEPMPQDIRSILTAPNLE